MLTDEQLHQVHDLIAVEDDDERKPAWIAGARLACLLDNVELDEPISTFAEADQVLRTLLNNLLDTENYLGAAALLWGRDVFDSRPDCVRDMFRFFHGYNKVLVQGAGSMGKCLGPDVPVMLFDGSVKPSELVEVGDVLMGDDHTPRNVLSTATGEGPMFLIYNGAMNWTCNDAHIITLVERGTNRIFDMELSDYLLILAEEPERRDSWFMFRNRPGSKFKEAVRFRVFPLGKGPYCGFVIDGNHRFLLGDCTVTHNTYTAMAWHYLDWRRDPLATSIKVAGPDEGHLKSNAFAHLQRLHRWASIPSEFTVEEIPSALFLGTKEGGAGFGFVGVAFKHSTRASASFRGFHPISVKRKHRSLGRFSRIRVLGDECVRGDQLVSMADGTQVPIQELVESKSTAEVWCMDLTAKRMVARPIVGWFKSPRRGREIISIGGAHITVDHRVYTSKGWIHAALARELAVPIIRMRMGEFGPFWSPQYPALEDEPCDDIEWVYCLGVEEHHNFFAQGVCISNCQTWPEGPFKDFGSMLASIDKRGGVKVTMCYNPESVDRVVVDMAMPEQGWQPEDMDTLYEWVSKKGWNVIRLDAQQSENVKQREQIFPSFQSYEGFLDNITEGEARFYCFSRGWPPVNASVSCVVPTAYLNEARGEAEFVGPVKIGASLDLAGSGGDRAMMAIFRWGMARSYRTVIGEHVVFMDRLNPLNAKPRLMLQVDQIVQLLMSADNVKCAQEIMAICKDHGIPPEMVALDRTGSGSGTYNHLANYWGNVLGIDWGTKASDLRVLADDKNTAYDMYELKISEMWFTVRRWLDPAVRAMLLHPLIPMNPLLTELTTRRWGWARGSRQKVEKKDEWKARNGGKSPDVADALVQACQLVRERTGSLPGLMDQIAGGDSGAPETPSDLKPMPMDAPHHMDGLDLPSVGAGPADPALPAGRGWGGME